MTGVLTTSVAWDGDEQNRPCLWGALGHHTAVRTGTNQQCSGGTGVFFVCLSCNILEM